MKKLMSLFFVIFFISCSENFQNNVENKALLEEISINLNHLIDIYKIKNLEDDSFARAFNEAYFVNGKNDEIWKTEDLNALRQNINSLYKYNPLGIDDFTEYYYNSVKQIMQETLNKSSRNAINTRSTPCTERFEADEADARLRSDAATALFGPIVGGAVWVYLINEAVNSWCACMESTHGVGCDEE